MDPKLAQLKTLLDQEISLHEFLKSHLAQEAARDGKMTGAELLRLQQLKHQKAQEIQHREGQRAALVKELAQTWGEPAGELTLRRIIEKAPQPLGEELAACHQRLLGLVKEIQALAGETGSNAQARLKAIDATLAVIGEAARLHPTYSDQGRLQKVTPTLRQTSA